MRAIQHSLDRFGEKFLRPRFYGREIEYSMSMKFPARHLAARFAGKEAVRKVWNRHGRRWVAHIDTAKGKAANPFLVFSGPAQELATKRGVTSALITLRPHRISRDGHASSSMKVNVRLRPPV